MARIDADLVIDSGQAVVALGGALDVSNAHRVGALLRRLLQEGCTDIVLDLRDVERVDATGVGILRGAARALERNNDNGRFGFREAPADLAEFLVDNGVPQFSEKPAPPAARAMDSEQALRRRPHDNQSRSSRQSGRTSRSRLPQP